MPENWSIESSAIQTIETFALQKTPFMRFEQLQSAWLRRQKEIFEKELNALQNQQRQQQQQQQHHQQKQQQLQTRFSDSVLFFFLFYYVFCCCCMYKVCCKSPRSVYKENENIFVYTTQPTHIAYMLDIYFHFGLCLIPPTKASRAAVLTLPNAQANLLNKLNEISKMKNKKKTRKKKK